MKKSQRKLIYDEVNLKSFAENLRHVRKQKGMTQEEIAYSVDIALSQIARIETYRTNPTLSTVFKIAKALGVHPKELFEGMKWEE